MAGLAAHGTERFGALRFGDGSLLASKESSKVDFSAMDYYHDMYAKGFVALAERAARAMGGAGGAIVGITAPGCSHATTPRAGTYDMPMVGKAAMEQMARYYARTLAPRGITVNCVSPGLTDTEAWRKMAAHMGQDAAQGASLCATIAKARCPMGKAIPPADIGACVAFLCSEGARFVTGNTLPVDGALHLVG